VKYFERERADEGSVLSDGFTDVKTTLEEVFSSVQNPTARLKTSKVKKLAKFTARIIKELNTISLLLRLKGMKRGSATRNDKPNKPDLPAAAAGSAAPEGLR
jgi:hypothetical protein